MLMFSKKALSTLEYTVLLVVCASALLLCFDYLKRGLQGRLRKNADVFSDRQYEPGVTRIVGR